MTDSGAGYWDVPSACRTRSRKPARWPCRSPTCSAPPTAYAVRLDDREWMQYLDIWIGLKQKDGTFQEIYDHWILGREAEKKGPRWSVIHWMSISPCAPCGTKMR